MGTRLQLHDILKGMTGVVEAYFQPPTNTQLAYPAIIYNLNYAAVQRADNKPYSTTWRYQVIVIDRDPDSLIPEQVLKLPMCQFVRRFTAEGLNHSIFYLYF